MSTRARSAGLLITASVVLVLSATLAAALCAPDVAAAAAASAAATAAQESSVNWGWLAAGLGGVLVLLAAFALLTRRLQRKQDKKK